MKALTRRQVLDLLSENEQFLDYFSCPDCRDLLTEHGESKFYKQPVLVCRNNRCFNHSAFSIDGEELGNYHG